MAGAGQRRNRRVRPTSDSMEKPRWWQRGPRWLLPMFAVVAVLLVGIFVTGQLLTVKMVEVSGTVNQESAAISEVLGIEPGDRMAGVDTGSTAAAVSQLPWVDTVTVSRRWPSTVKISVTEHVAVGYLKDGGTQILIDAEGRQFLRINAPTLNSPDAVAVPAGVVPFEVSLSDEEAIKAAAAAMDAFNVLSPELRGQLVAVEAPAADSITFSFLDDRTVFWGSSERAAEKAEATRVVLSRDGARWNVSNPALPAVRG